MRPRKTLQRNLGRGSFLATSYLTLAARPACHCGEKRPPCWDFFFRLLLVSRVVGGGSEMLGISYRRDLINTAMRSLDCMHTTLAGSCRKQMRRRPKVRAASWFCLARCMPLTTSADPYQSRSTRVLYISTRIPRGHVSPPEDTHRGLRSEFPARISKKGLGGLPTTDNPSKSPPSPTFNQGRRSLNLGMNHPPYYPKVPPLIFSSSPTKGEESTTVGLSLPRSGMGHDFDGGSSGLRARGARARNTNFVAARSHLRGSGLD